MIRLDPRAGSGHYAKPLRALGVTVRDTTHLRSGDASWLGHGPADTFLRVGVEIKKVNDLLACILDNRFTGLQLPRMMEDGYGIIYLLVEGVTRPSPEGLIQKGLVIPGRDPRVKIVKFLDAHRRLMYQGVDGFLTTLEQKAGVIVLRTFDEAETVATLRSRYLWWQKEWDQHKSLTPMLKLLKTATRAVREETRTDVLQLTQTSTIRKMLAQIPEIGWKRAKDAEAAFGDRIRNAILQEIGVQEWATLQTSGSRLGIKRATQVQRALSTHK